MKNSNARVQAQSPPAGSRPVRGGLHAPQRVFRTEVVEGDVIRFDPTGEQLRVSKIANGRITFEKLP